MRRCAKTSRMAKASVSGLQGFFTKPSKASLGGCFDEPKPWSARAMMIASCVRGSLRRRCGSCSVGRTPRPQKCHARGRLPEERQQALRVALDGVVNSSSLPKTCVVIKGAPMKYAGGYGPERSVDEGCRRLAIRVIDQAFRDLSGSVGSRADRESARAFLDGSWMLHRRCDIANVTAAWMVARARTLDRAFRLNTNRPEGGRYHVNTVLESGSSAGSGPGRWPAWSRRAWRWVPDSRRARSSS
jgi:hypothetical protein